MLSVISFSESDVDSSASVALLDEVLRLLTFENNRLELFCSVNPFDLFYINVTVIESLNFVISDCKSSNTPSFSIPFNCNLLV